MKKEAKKKEYEKESEKNFYKDRIIFYELYTGSDNYRTLKFVDKHVIEEHESEFLFTFQDFNKFLMCC